MNKYVFSAKNNAFYPVTLQGSYLASNTWPDDGLSIDDAISEEYMAEPPEGKIRCAGVDGYPTWGQRPEPTHNELVSAANAEKQERIERCNKYMNSKQWPGKAVLGRLRGDELEQYHMWLDYLDALESVDTSTAPNIVWPPVPA